MMKTVIIDKTAILNKFIQMKLAKNKAQVIKKIEHSLMKITEKYPFNSGR